MPRKKQDSGFLKASMDSAPLVPDEPMSPEAAKLISEQYRIAAAAMDDVRKLIGADIELAAKTRAARMDGGRETGKQRAQKAATKYEQWRREAYDLICSGTCDRHNTANILAKRHGVSRSTIRRGINKAKKTRTS